MSNLLDEAATQEDRKGATLKPRTGAFAPPLAAVLAFGLALIPMNGAASDNSADASIGGSAIASTASGDVFSLRCEGRDFETAFVGMKLIDASGRQSVSWTTFRFYEDLTVSVAVLGTRRSLKVANHEVADTSFAVERTAMEDGAIRIAWGIWRGSGACTLWRNDTELTESVSSDVIGLHLATADFAGISVQARAGFGSLLAAEYVSRGFTFGFLTTDVGATWANGPETSDFRVGLFPWIGVAEEVPGAWTYGVLAGAGTRGVNLWILDAR